jgi:hypothetical protein
MSGTGIKKENVKEENNKKGLNVCREEIKQVGW